MKILCSISDVLKDFYKDHNFQFVAKISLFIIGSLGILSFYLKYQSARRKRSYPRDTVILHQIKRGLRCPRFKLCLILFVN